MKVVARSASDRTDDWPYWMVWDGSLNVTVPVLRAIFQRDVAGGKMPFLSRSGALLVAEMFNAMRGEAA